MHIINTYTHTDTHLRAGSTCTHTCPHTQDRVGREALVMLIIPVNFPCYKLGSSVHADRDRAYSEIVECDMR